MKVPIKDLCSILCAQICSFLQIFSHLLKKEILKRKASFFVVCIFSKIIVSMTWQQLKKPQLNDKQKPLDFLLISLDETPWLKKRSAFSFFTNYELIKFHNFFRKTFSKSSWCCSGRWSWSSCSSTVGSYSSWIHKCW